MPEDPHSDPDNIADFPEAVDAYLDEERQAALSAQLDVEERLAEPGRVEPRQERPPSRRSKKKKRGQKTPADKPSVAAPRAAPSWGKMVPSTMKRMSEFPDRLSHGAVQTEVFDLSDPEQKKAYNELKSREPTDAICGDIQIIRDKIDFYAGKYFVLISWVDIYTSIQPAT